MQANATLTTGLWVVRTAGHGLLECMLTCTYARLGVARISDVNKSITHIYPTDCSFGLSHCFQYPNIFVVPPSPPASTPPSAPSPAPPSLTLFRADLLLSRAGAGFLGDGNQQSLYPLFCSNTSLTLSSPPHLLYLHLHLQLPPPPFAQRRSQKRTYPLQPLHDPFPSTKLDTSLLLVFFAALGRGGA